MKTVTLRSLVRDPIQVKKMTRLGNAVQVTDRGEPLWIIRSAAADQEGIPADEFDQEYEAMKREPKSAISASKIVIDSRR